MECQKVCGNNGYVIATPSPSVSLSEAKNPDVKNVEAKKLNIRLGVNSVKQSGTKCHCDPHCLLVPLEITK